MSGGWEKESSPNLLATLVQKLGIATGGWGQDGKCWCFAPPLKIALGIRIGEKGISPFFVVSVLGGDSISASWEGRMIDKVSVHFKYHRL
jgi:hypothetical protein